MTTLATILKTKNKTLVSVILLLGFSVLNLAVFAADNNGSQRQAFDPELKALLISVASQGLSFEDEFDARVWLTDMSNRLGSQVDDSEERLQLLTAVHREAKRVDLQPELVLAVMDVESAFDRFAISRVGARGLMQIMPFWMDEIGRPNDNLFHIDTNVRYGCTILKYYIDMEKGNLFRALGRYNGSLGKAKYPNKVFSKLNRRWFVQ